MHKPLFFTAIMSLAACLMQDPASAQTTSPKTQAAKPCPDGKTWDNYRKKCVSTPRGSHGE